jgi:hypothetical protein
VLKVIFAEGLQNPNKMCLWNFIMDTFGIMSQDNSVSKGMAPNGRTGVQFTTGEWFFCLPPCSKLVLRHTQHHSQYVVWAINLSDTRLDHETYHSPPVVVRLRMCFDLLSIIHLHGMVFKHKANFTFTLLSIIPYYSNCNLTCSGNISILLHIC